MPELSQKESIKLFIEDYRKQNPESPMTDKQIEDIVTIESRFIKYSMAREDLPIIHIKYFGDLYIEPDTIYVMKLINNVYKRRGYISEKQWQDREDYLEAYFWNIFNSKIQRRAYNKARTDKYGKRVLN